MTILVGLGVMTGCYFALRLQYYQEFIPLLALLGFAGLLELEERCRRLKLPSGAVVGGIFGVLLLVMPAIAFVTLANGLESWGSRPALTKLRLAMHALLPSRSGIDAPPTRYGPEDEAEWRTEGERFYRFSAPALLTSPCNDPMLLLDFDGSPLDSGRMRIKVDGRVVSDASFGSGRSRVGVPLGHGQIIRGDLVVVQLLFDRSVVPALTDPNSADLRPLTVRVHELGLSCAGLGPWALLTNRAAQTLRQTPKGEADSRSDSRSFGRLVATVPLGFLWNPVMGTMQ